jgi:hypothetical protein
MLNRRIVPAFLLFVLPLLAAPDTPKISPEVESIVASARSAITEVAFLGLIRIAIADSALPHSKRLEWLREAFETEPSYPQNPCRNGEASLLGAGSTFISLMAQDLRNKRLQPWSTL